MNKQSRGAGALSKSGAEAFRRLDEFLSRSYASFFLGAILGAAFFVLFFGTKVLDPTYVDWLLGGFDIKQHYLGWVFFREAQWQFPLGIISQLAYPFGMPITYMDSIPLLAIPLKLFDGVLPQPFQYFGIWGLSCYMLQGGFAALIVRRWSRSVMVTLLGTVFFILSPLMLARIFAHTALAGHWIILVAILLFLYREKLTTTVKQVASWSAVLAAAIMIHPYFVPMVALPFALTLIMTHRTWGKSLITATLPLAATVIIFWIIGGFSVGTTGAQGGLGDYALNLNGLLNPLGWSNFMKDAPLASESVEGMSYLGIGTIALLVVALSLKIGAIDSQRKLRKQIVAHLTWRKVLAALSFLAIILLALSPRIQLNAVTLVQLDLPRKIESLWSIFRASGRLFWVVYYFIIVGVFAYILQATRRVPTVIISGFLLLLTVMQAADIGFSPMAKDKHAYFTHIEERTKATRVPAEWGEYTKGKKHLFYLDGIDAPAFFALADVAYRDRLTLNTGYFARSPDRQIQELQSEQRERLLNQTADMQSYLFVTKDKVFIEALQEHGYEIHLFQGFSIITRQ